MSESLYLKYRPEALAEVVGQDAVVRSLESMVAKKNQHAFLFVGPSGCGKTTLARCTAAAMGCRPSDIVEADAATNNGIDDVRLITESLQYKPMNGGIKAIVIDECHALSANAWKALLKSTEEPPNWAVWFLCTTDAAKVPKTIQTRFASLTVKPVSWQTILSDILQPVAQAEGYSTSDAVLGVCARMADGSPRQALVNLAACSDAADEKEAAQLLKAADDALEGPVVLARALVKGTDWENVVPIIASLKDENPESIRHVVRGYVTAILLGGKSGKGTGKLLAILDNFSTPFNGADGISPVLLAVGRLLVH